MNKAIMIADKPKWCAKIMNRDKLIEVRRNKALYKATMKLIEEQGYATFFMYCTKDKEFCFHDIFADKGGYKPLYYLDNREHDSWSEKLNGKVVAKFTVRKVEEIECAIDYYHEDGRDCTYHTDSMCQEVLGECSCLYNDIDEYLDWKPDNIVGYAYHIEDLVIFDEPKELREFYKFGKREYMKNYKPHPEVLKVYKKYGGLAQLMDLNCEANKWRLTKAPQNFVFVESEE